MQSRKSIVAKINEISFKKVKTNIKSLIHRAVGLTNSASLE